MDTSRKRLGTALGFAGTCLFAGTLPATRLAVGGLDPLFVTAARATIAGLVALIVLAVSGRRPPPRSAWLDLFGGAAGVVVGFPLFAALGMRVLPAAHGGVVLGILPLATAAAASVFARERPSGAFWLASAAGAVTVLAFVFRRGGGLGAISAGDLFLLGNVAAGAIGYTLSGRLAMRMPGWEVISWQVVCLFPVAALATFALWPPNMAAVPASSWIALGYIGLVSQYTGFFVFNAAMAMIGIARVGQIMLLQPFITVALAWPVNGERIDPETLLFAAAVVVTVVVGQRTRVGRR